MMKRREKKWGRSDTSSQIFDTAKFLNRETILGMEAIKNVSLFLNK